MPSPPTERTSRRSGRGSEVFFSGAVGPASQPTRFSGPLLPGTRPHQRLSRLMNRRYRSIGVLSTPAHVDAVHDQAQSSSDGLRCEVVPGGAVERYPPGRADCRSPGGGDGNRIAPATIVRQCINPRFCSVDPDSRAEADRHRHTIFDDREAWRPAVKIVIEPAERVSRRGRGWPLSTGRRYQVPRSTRGTDRLGLPPPWRPARALTAPPATRP